MKNLNLSRDLKDIRENIDILIMERSNKKSDQEAIQPNSLVREISNDKALERIKREKIEKEYNELNKEVLKMRDVVYITI
jgi:hypothetical protein